MYGEDREDETVRDLELTHKFQHLFSNEIFRAMIENKGQLRTFAANAMRIVKAVDECFCKDYNIVEIAASLGLDPTDPTHDSYINAASWYLTFRELEIDSEE